MFRGRQTYFSLIFAFLENAPDQCHIFIFQGAEGPKGDKGEKGDAGSPCLQNNHVRSWQHEVSFMTQGQAKLGGCRIDPPVPDPSAKPSCFLQVPK